MHETLLTRVSSTAAGSRDLEILSLAYFYCDTHAVLGKNRPENDIVNHIHMKATFYYRFNVCMCRLCHRHEVYTLNR